MNTSIHLLIVVSVLNDHDGLTSTYLSIIQQALPSSFAFTLFIQDPSNSSLSSLIQPHPRIFISHQPDLGISHAFNIALLTAPSSWTHTLFLGAGDLFLSPTSLYRMLSEVSLNPGNLLFSFPVRRQSQSDQTLYIDYPSNNSYNQLNYKNIFPHQGLITAKSYYTQYGIFNQNIRFSMDYDLLYRSFPSSPPTYVSNNPFTSWKAGGLGQNKNLQIIFEQWRFRSLYPQTNPYVNFFFFVLTLSYVLLYRPLLLRLSLQSHNDR